MQNLADRETSVFVQKGLKTFFFPASLPKLKSSFRMRILLFVLTSVFFHLLYYLSKTLELVSCKTAAPGIFQPSFLLFQSCLRAFGFLNQSAVFGAAVGRS